MAQHFLPNGEELIIRPVNGQDAAMLLDFFRLAVEQSDYLLTTPEEVAPMTVAMEKEFLRPFIQNPHSLLLVAMAASRAVGVLSLAQARSKKQAHVAELGIIVRKDYWNLGIGRRMMQTMIHWVEDQELIRMVQLSVFASNEKAIRLYTHFGFREKGRIEKMFRQPDGDYQDLITMSRWIDQEMAG